MCQLTCKHKNVNIYIQMFFLFLCTITVGLRNLLSTVDGMSDLLYTSIFPKISDRSFKSVNK